MNTQAICRALNNVASEERAIGWRTTFAGQIEGQSKTLLSLPDQSVKYIFGIVLNYKSFLTYISLTCNTSIIPSLPPFNVVETNEYATD